MFLNRSTIEYEMNRPIRSIRGDERENDDNRWLKKIFVYLINVIGVEEKNGRLMPQIHGCVYSSRSRARVHKYKEKQTREQKTQWNRRYR